MKKGVIKECMVNLLSLVTILVVSNEAKSQLSITQSGNSPYNSAILQVEADLYYNKGVLIPRLSMDERNSLGNPAEGLLIYNTSTNKFNYWNGEEWIEILSLEIIVSQATGSGTIDGVAINSDGSDPHHSALLEIKGSNGGILIPRMTTGQRNTISNLVNGLIIYNTETHRFNYYDGSEWKELCGISDGNATGNNTADFGVAINTDGSDPDPSALLDIRSTFGGLLIPRLTNSQRNAIPSPEIGLWIYNTESKTFQVYKGNGIWLDIGPNSIPAPTATNATNVQQSSFTANWNTVPGATGYYIDVATCVGFTGCYVAGYQNLDVGNVTSYNATGLSCNTTYYYRIRAYNNCGISVNSNNITVTTGICTTPACGNQMWMLANMNVGNMINGSNEQSDDNQIEKYCYSDNSSNCSTYGGLYQWAEAMQFPYSFNSNNATPDYNCDPCDGSPGKEPRQGICPTGFHIPTDLEFSRYEWCVETTITPTGSTSLLTFQNDVEWRGSNSTAGPGHKMKSMSNWNGSNSSGFSALPGGYRDTGKYYDYLSISAFFWTATEYNNFRAHYREFRSGYFQVWRHNSQYRLKTDGLSIRCLKD